MRDIQTSDAEKLQQLHNFVRRQRRWPGHTHIAEWALTEIERLMVRDHELSALLFEVRRKFPGETRFQTALRYIKQAEMPPTIQISSTAKSGE